MKSSKPKKQRKQHYTMPLHMSRKAFSAHLSNELRGELGRRSLEIRKEDKVKVMRGKYKGKEGKVVRLERGKFQVFIDKITIKKTSGKEVNIPFRPSNLMLTEVSREDKKRLKRKKAKKAPKKDSKKENK